MERVGVICSNTCTPTLIRLLQKSDKCWCACVAAREAKSGSSFDMLFEDIGDTVLSEEHVTKTGYDKSMSMIYQARPNVPETESLLSCHTRILLVNLIKRAVKESGGR
jgi:hypothetical protein